MEVRSLPFTEREKGSDASCEAMVSCSGALFPSGYLFPMIPWMLESA